MAGKEASITVRILGDGKGAKDAAGDVESAYGGLSGKMAGFAAGIGAAIGTFAVDMGEKLISAAGEWVDLAKQADIFSKKADIVFGDSAASVKTWADGINESLGLSDEVVVGLAASMGDLLVPLGFTREAAAAMSEKSIELAGALSAWSGGTVDAAEVSDIMTKAMLGETDGLKALGISISADEIARKAAAMAAEGQTFATDAQAKAAATQALIMEKSTDAQTAWADGSMDAVKAANENKASMADLQTMIGQKLLPIVEKATEWLGVVLPIAFGYIEGAINTVTPYVERFIGWLRDVIPPIVEALRAWFEENWPAIQAAIAAVFDWLTTVAWPVVQAVFVALVDAAMAVVDWFVENWDTISATVKTVFDAAKLTVETVIGVIKTVIETVTGAIRTIWETWGTTIMTFIQGKWDAIKLIIDGVINVIRGIIQTVTSLIKGDWEGVWNGISTFISGIWTIIKGVINDAINSVKFAMGLVWDGIKGKVTEVWNGIKQFIGETWQGIYTTVTGLIGTVRDAIQGVWDTITGAASTAWNLVKTTVTGIWDGIVNTITGIPDRIGTTISGLFDGVKNAAKTAFNGVASIWNSTVGKLSFHVPDWIPIIGGKGFDVPDIGLATFHTGGIVPGRIGEEVPAMLLAGERVLTVQQQRAAGMDGGGRSGPLVGNLYTGSTTADTIEALRRQEWLERAA